MGRPKRSAAKQSSEKVKMLMVEDNREASGAVCSIPSTSDSEFSDASSISDSDSDMSDKVIEINSDSDPESRNKRKESPVSKENRLSSTLKEKGKRKSSSTDRQGGKQPKTATCSSGAGAKKKGKGLWGKDNVKLGDLDWEVWENELQSWGPWGNDSEIDIESLTRKKNPLDVKEPPPELLVPLLPFQMEWLGWSLKQEESNIRGGILADEMGMGKTIQAISLILASRALCHPNAIPNLPEEGRLSNALSTSTVGSSNLAWLHRSSSNLPLENSPGLGELPQVKATLVVCPLVAVIQWRNEIIRFTKEGSVKVLIYHGTKRCKNISELADYDIVLTTYAIAELEHRVSVMPAKEPCVWCGRLFYPDRMAVHLRFYCGPTAQRTEKQAKQVKKRGPRTFKRMLGKEMEGIGKDLYPSKVNKKNPEVAGKESEVIKDIQQLMSAVDGAEPKKKRGRKKKVQQEELEAALQEATDSLAGDPVGENQCVGTDRGISLLHAVKWNRVILDEAHSIKDRRCSTAKAIFALRSKYKWALSGTPLQNRVGELYSLVRFLEIEPFSYYYCRICNCKSLDYSFGKEWRKCDHCQHSPLHHFCWWNKFIANPIKKWGYVNEGRKAMILLKYKLLDSTLLRRTKIERAADLALPPRTTFLRRDAFDTREDDFYQALYTQSQSQFNTYIAAGTLLNNYAHIFDLLTRLRQAVDHPYLVVYSTSSLSVANKSFNPSPLEGACGICNDPAEEAVATACNHVFCKACIQDYVLAAGETSGGQARPCPTCQKPLTVDLTGSRQVSGQDGIAKVKGYKRSSILNRINLDEFQTSSKIDALREEVMLMLEKDPAAKAIVFSQFTSFLDLIGFCLQKAGIKCVKLDGSMSMAARDQMIESFTNDPDIKVFLMSLKAGGVALNLTVASHVFLMDPWWNPAVEQQAQDRIHRIGQYKPIRVVRFVIENTIEERILRLQEKKQLVFEGTVGGSAEALGRLTEDDLRFLFTS